MADELEIRAASEAGQVAETIRGVLARPISRRGVLQVMGAGAAATFLAACGTSASPSPASQAPSAGTSSAPTAAPSVAPSTPSTGGTLRMVGDQVLTDLEPRSGLGPAAVLIRRNVNLALLEVDSATGAVSPLLASELPTQEGDLAWLVKIKPGLKWHDGTDVTAGDVKYTVDWMLNKDNNSIFGSVVLDGVDAIEVVDPTTVRFKLKRQIGSFMERLGAICPVPAGAAEAMGKDKFKLAPVGNGPFKFSEFVADDHETIEAFEGYSLEPKPTLGKVELRRVLEGTGRTTALQTEQAEVDLNADPELFGILEGSGLKTTITDNDAGYNAIMLNNGTAPFNDKRVRVAMAHAIDRDEIVQAVWNGNAVPQYTSLPPWYFLHSPNLSPYEFDPEKSKALLKEAGHTEPLEIELMQGIYSTGLTMAAVLQKQLEAAGFKVRIKTGDADGLYSFVFDATWQAFSMRGNTSIVGLYPDVMTRWVLQKVFNNAPDEELAPLVKAFADADGIAPADLDKRKAAYYAIQDTIVQDARLIFLVNRKGLTAHRPVVQGISYAPDGVPNVLTKVSLA